MARRRSRRPADEAPGWPFLLVGLTIGLAVAAFVYFSDLRSGASGDEPTQPPSARTPPPAGAPPLEPPDAPGAAGGDAAGTGDGEAGTRFDFYDILPQYEVDVPDAGQRRQAPGPASAPEAPAGEPERYVLQAGSFSTFADADRMKASLALLGIESRIQEVAIEDRRYHRVRIGPIEGVDELSRVTGELRRAGIDTLVMQVE